MDARIYPVSSSQRLFFRCLHHKPNMMAGIKINQNINVESESSLFVETGVKTHPPLTHVPWLQSEVIEQD